MASLGLRGTVQENIVPRGGGSGAIALSFPQTGHAQGQTCFAGAFVISTGTYGINFLPWAGGGGAAKFNDHLSDWGS